MTEKDKEIKDFIEGPCPLRAGKMLWFEMKKRQVLESLTVEELKRIERKRKCREALLDLKSEVFRNMDYDGPDPDVRAFVRAMKFQYGKK